MKSVRSCAILRNKAGDLLLQQRDIEPEKGKWVLFGGAVEPGETEEQACRREIKEELNYTLKTLSFFKRYDDLKAETPIFIAVEPVRLDQLNLQEGSAMNFFTLQEINTLPIGFNQKQILLDFLQRK